VSHPEWNEPLIKEWPHSRALGEKWVVYPPANTEPWPGLKFFGTEQEANDYADKTYRQPS
jgi:hypothetical protein